MGAAQRDRHPEKASNYHTEGDAGGKSGKVEHEHTRYRCHDEGEDKQDVFADRQSSNSTPLHLEDSASV